MANTLPSPSMNLQIPVVGGEPGPLWATDINNCLTIIDGHNHTAGYGVPVPSAGLNINADLSFGNNNLINSRSIRFQPQPAVLIGANDLGCLYETGVDLYYNDGLGNNIRITQSGGVAGTSGSISGLTSPASASYVSADSSFVWQSAASTPANMDGASFIFRNLVANSFGLTLSPPNAMAADYTITLPTLPTQQNIVTMDSSGNMGAVWNVDNSSITVSANNLQVATNGITTAKIADGNVTRAKLSAVGQITSASSGGVNIPAGGGYIQVLTLTITTTGRPVMVMIQPDGASSAGSNPAQILFNFLGVSSVGGRVAIARDGASTPYISEKNYANQVSGSSVLMTFDASSSFLDSPSAGTHTYTVYAVNANSSTFMTFFNYKLVAYEL